MRFSPRVFSAVALTASLLAPAVARAQEVDPQVALRARWRVSLELATHLSVPSRRTAGGVVLEGDGFFGGTIGASAWRAVHPWVDLGGRLGVRLPDTRQVSAPYAEICPGTTNLARYPNGYDALGIVPHLTLGARVRPGGPSLPLHLSAGVAGSLWIPTRTNDITWQCAAGGPTESRRPGPLFGVAAVLGVSSHFGPAEEFSVGLEYWQPLDPAGAAQNSLGLTFGWQLNRGDALPGSHRGRGRVPSIVTGVVGGALWITGFALLAFYGSIG